MVKNMKKKNIYIIIGIITAALIGYFVYKKYYVAAINIPAVKIKSVEKSGGNSTQ
jgi:hypothetical protein